MSTEQFIGPDGNTIVLQFTGRPTAEDYLFVQEYITLRLRNCFVCEVRASYAACGDAKAGLAEQ